MARTIGDYIGTTFKNFLILPGYTTEEHTPDVVDISADLGGVRLGKPFLPAAMRSVVGKEMALASSKAGAMPVAPRGLTIDRQAEIIRHVREKEVRVGEIESAARPICLSDSDTLGAALECTLKYGHSNIPVRNDMAELVGMFTYRPIDHDRMDRRIPITNPSVMTPFDPATSPHCRSTMSDDEIKNYMRENKLRFVPVIDQINRLSRLVFMQMAETYKVGGAIDTYPGWEARARALVDAGTDMIFTDTSDANSAFVVGVIRRYKEMFPEGPPICGGNIVTRDAFARLVEAGADAIKVGMGPGSICKTNSTLAVGAPQFWAVKEIADERDAYGKACGRHIPIICDGGVEDTWDINVALTHADAVMGGRLFAGFDESAGGLVVKEGKSFKEYWGEGSRRAAETSGDMNRYHMGGNGDRSSLITEGVDALVEHAGHLKPGIEAYAKVLRLALSHTGSRNMAEYRWNAVLVRLSEEAKGIAVPHGLAHYMD